MSSCHLTAGCSPETQYGSVTRTGRGHLTLQYLLPPQSHSSTLWAATTQGRSCARDWGSSTPQCLEGRADSHDRRGGAHAAILFMFSIPNDIGGQGGDRTHTHTSKNQSLQAKPVLCSFLVAQVAGLAFRGNRSPNQRWFCQESFRSGCPPDRMVLTTAELITPTALSFCNRNLFSVKYRQS